MDNRFELLILVDNTAAGPGLEAPELGLSFWIRAEDKNILLDTGQGPALPDNARRLGIDLKQTDLVVLSHGHYDHTGGLKAVFGQGASPTVFMNPSVVQRRYSRQQEPPHKPIGMPAEVVSALSANGARVVSTTQPTQIADHVWVTGPVPRRTDFEDTGGAFYLDEACRVEDALTDDQSVWMETAEGIVLLLGCAHSGVINTLDYVAELTGVSEFRAVIGGMHLLNASEERIAATARAFERHRVGLIAPCHCTGEAAMAALAERVPGGYAPAGAGSRFIWT